MNDSLPSRSSTPHWGLPTNLQGTFRRKRDRQGGLYSALLVRDLQEEHFAYELHVAFDGVSYDTGSELLQALLQELGSYRRDNPTRLIEELIATVARDHLLYGRSIFELFADVDKKSTRPTLGLLPGWTLKSKHGSFLQILPQKDGVTWLALPPDSLIDFVLPDDLGRELHRVATTLRQLEAHSPTQSSLLTNPRATGYEFESHKRSIDMMVARTTRNIGWSGRNLFIEHATNSYQTYRSLMFRRTWLIIALAVVERLNHVCNHPAISNGRSLKVRLEGLPSVEEIERSMAAVTEGTESLDDIFYNVLHPRK